jgi:hypothetical protein
MAYMDAALSLSNAQAVTSTAFSTNAVDLRGAVRAGGSADDAVQVFVHVAQSATASGAATVNFQIVTSAAADLSSPTIIGQTDAIPKASLVAGSIITIPIPRSFINAPGQRYIGLRYVVTTGPLTAGAFSAYIALQGIDSADATRYPVGYSIK